jgi:hypothetical protein
VKYAATNSGLRKSGSASRCFEYYWSVRKPWRAFSSRTIGKCGIALTFGGVHFLPRFSAIRRIESSRLQVASARPSARRFWRYSFSVFVVSRPTFSAPKYGRMFASIHHLKTFWVEAF